MVARVEGTRSRKLVQNGQEMPAHGLSAGAPDSARQAPGPLAEMGPGARLIGHDLSGQDLSNLDLSGADLSGADLTGAKLINTTLVGAKLFGSTLDGAHLLGADLTKADLTEAKASGAILGGVKLDDATLFGANLDGATLSESSLERADLRSATFRGTRLRGANLEHAELRSCDLSGADLSGARVGGADFGDATLREATFRGIRGFQDAHWIGVDISAVDFTGAYALRRTIMDDNYLNEFKTASRTSGFVYLLWKLTSDCGRSLARWALVTCAMAVMFGLAYTTVALDYGDYETSLSPFYFSVVTLTTLGYGDVLPASLGAQIVVLAEVVVGYIMLGGLLSIFATKMGRRAE